jgi:hypothetical protein
MVKEVDEDSASHTEEFSMDVETRITLPEDMVQELAPEVAKHGSLSKLVEITLRELVKKTKRQMRDARELEIINAHAEELDREALDVLQYQIEI